MFINIVDNYRDGSKMYQYTDNAKLFSYTRTAQNGQKLHLDLNNM